MSKTWFEEWFDTPYYHILYSYRDENEAKSFLINLLHYLEIPQSSKIIDIGCGRGRHARILNREGYDVTGIDIAPSNIEYARKYENEKLHFFCHDKREPFRDAEFDLALNLFTSYGFLENRSELLTALKSMVKNLKENGILVMDYLNADIIRKQEFHQEEQSIKGLDFQINKRIEGHQIIKDIDVLDGDKTSHFREQVHLITLKEFQDLFTQASLKILHTFGDYELNEYEPESSIRLIIIAQKV